MQIPRWRNVLSLKNSLRIATLLPPPTTSADAAATSIRGVASFHSTPTSCEKWKSKWNADAKGAQQPSKTYIRYQTRYKRADAKRALKDLLFTSGSSKSSFQDDEDLIWEVHGNNGGDTGSDTKGRPKSSARRFGKSDSKRRKCKIRRGSFSEDFDDPETNFQGRYGNRRCTWTHQKRGEYSFQSSASGFEWREHSFQSSASGFEWREHSNKTHRRTRDWENESDVEADDEFGNVGSSSERSILGLPLTGPLKLDDVKNAFRLSALKWHPDKHQGSSQAMAEEKFKSCLNAYKSLCSGLA